MKTMILDNMRTSPKKYECDICKDSEWVYIPGEHDIKPCKCQEAKRYRKILEHSGISEQFRTKTLKNYNATLDIQKNALQMACDFVRGFEDKEHAGVAFLGQPGAGKTHLTVAIANALMKRNIGVLYMQYREDIVKIKQCASDKENYQREINRYKNAKVLLIDDLFKGAIKKDRYGNEYINDADYNAMFEIINCRCFKQVPIIFSSEYCMKDLMELDDAIGGRIFDMCGKTYFIEFRGRELNYRLVV